MTIIIYLFIQLLVRPAVDNDRSVFSTWGRFLEGVAVEFKERRAGIWNALVWPGGKVELENIATLHQLKNINELFKI